LELPEAELDTVVEGALGEDTAHGDITSELLIPAQLQGQGYILVKGRGVLAGMNVARRVFLKVDPRLKMDVLIGEGERVRPGDTAAVVSGSVRSILEAERTVLNFLQRLSGIASETARYVGRVKGYSVTITDTRKTTPGLRLLEKYAVRLGGGHNHRFHLGDGILIKDNHLAALRALGMSLRDIITQAKQAAPQGVKVEVEVTNLADAIEAGGAGADIVMLDNMAPEEMQRVVGSLPRGVETEASGGITLAKVRRAAMTGVSTISIGALTHSVRVLDISLELEPQTLKLI